MCLLSLCFCVQRPICVKYVRNLQQHRNSLSKPEDWIFFFYTFCCWFLEIKHSWAVANILTTRFFLLKWHLLCAIMHKAGNTETTCNYMTWYKFNLFCNSSYVNSNHVVTKCTLSSARICRKRFHIYLCAMASNPSPFYTSNMIS